MPTDSDHRSLRGINIFNRVCSAIALLYLIAFSCLQISRDPTFHDYPQYHLAGSVAAAGVWNSIYPSPIPGSTYNAGFWKASAEKPDARAIAIRRKIDPAAPHFMQPPPVALLLVPLGRLNTEIQGYSLWILISAISVWIAAKTSAQLYERCAGRQSYWTGLLLLLIASCPLTIRAVTVGNVSTMMAASIGLAILSLDPEAPSPRVAAIAIAFGSMLKYADLLFLPIALRQRAWRALMLSAVILIAWSLVALLVMGVEPFRQFVIDIVPTLGRSHEYSDNVSLAGVLLRIFHQQPPLSSWLTIPIMMVQGISLLVILLLIWRQKPAMPVASVAAASATLMAWLLIYSPITWTHYLVYLYPLWGWMIWQGGRSKLHGVFAIVAIGIVALSLPTEPPVSIDRVGYRFLISLLMTMLLGIDSLIRTARWPVIKHNYASRPERN